MQPSRKRPRPTLSCRECRQRKLRCDRSQPCQQCAKGQREGLCIFDTEQPRREPANQVSADPKYRTSAIRNAANQHGHLLPSRTQAPQVQGGIIEDLQARVASLEAIIHAERAVPERLQNLVEQAIGTLSVKDDRCRYYGNGYRYGLFERVHGMASSMLQPSADPQLWSLAKEVQGLSKRLAADRAPPQKNGGHSLTHLRDALPEKDVCGSLLDAYFALYEERLVILHKPTFMPSYSYFMDKIDPSTTDNHVEPQLYAAIGLAAHHLQSSDHPHRDAARQWLRLHPFAAIEAWSRALPRRARAGLPALQTQTLLVLSQPARGVHIHEYWQSTNSLVRSAMTLGLHREPNQFRRFTIPQADLRRRLWWSIVEMDLRASTSYGMPASISPEDTDCLQNPFPDTLDVNAFFAGTLSDDQFNITQDCLAQSLSSRLAFANTTSRPVHPTSRARVTQLWREINDATIECPLLIVPEAAHMECRQKTFIAFFIALHGTLLMSVELFLAAGKTTSADCVHGAAKLLRSLNHLVPNGQAERAIEPYLNLFVIEYMHDIYKAVAVVSTYLDSCCNRPDVDDPALNPDSLFPLLKSTIRVFIERAAFEYLNLKDILSLSISVSLAEARYRKGEERENCAGRTGRYARVST
ncbi:hypothetical protein MPH_07298 [Macrophomina phaseolina MS6]|uniref:Zn(2)-C6 fungal-type domain-containing protein n=1 Tax=Macrophomina phaseolina (strain MS6) TaxID=1126212 RepID=K2QZP8_MACPH|nr:hypothetical protein MPH_07298 [Macrophomina phaseolina MS6]